jgi:hypothetical protein
MNVTATALSSEQTIPLAQRKQQLEQQETMKLIDGAGQATQAAQATVAAPPSSQPPREPVKVEPREGSSVEVVA